MIDRANYIDILDFASAHTTLLDKFQMIFFIKVWSWRILTNQLLPFIFLIQNSRAEAKRIVWSDVNNTISLRHNFIAHYYLCLFFIFLSVVKHKTTLTSLFCYIARGTRAFSLLVGERDWICQ